jgi:hypothetical protein
MASAKRDANARASSLALKQTPNIILRLCITNLYNIILVRETRIFLDLQFDAV